MRTLVLFSIFLVGCSPGETDAGDDESDRTIRPILAGRLENRDIDEASGIARSQTASDVYWVINDSGKPRLHPIDGRGRSLGRVKLDGAKLSDWEDIASFTLDGQPYLVVADIGDNDAERKDVRLYMIEEPDPGDEEVDVAWEFDFTYPDQPHDAEAVAVDVENERVLVLTKRQIPAVLYEVPLRPDSDGRQVAVPLGAPALPQPRRPDIEFAPKTDNWWWQPTGMDFANDGRAAVILTYRGVFYYPRKPGEDWIEALKRRPLALSTGDYGEAESIAFNADGTAIIITLEGRGAPVIRIDLERTTDQ